MWIIVVDISDINCFATMNMYHTPIKVNKTHCSY